MDQTRETIEDCLDESLHQVILSGRKNQTNGASKVKLRPVLVKGTLLFQAEEFVPVASGTGRKAFHRNLTKEQAVTYIIDAMRDGFSQCQIQTQQMAVTLLRNKKGEIGVVRKKKISDASQQTRSLSHDKAKQYILTEGQAVPFLVDLGVMTADGRLVKAKYSKFRQLNRFLEFIQDVLPELPRGRELSIIDFGCGKSYLTFAMYYYLKEQMGYDVRITGLDLKEDVIARCNALAEKYGYDKLCFLLGDIAGYQGSEKVDMVVTLHACDTATDYALAKAVAWNTDVILSVPCCQHELNRQIQSDLLAPVLKYGLLKERVAALLTDGIRAGLLERHGYEVQVMEFIDMEHTPKNILLRAVRKKNKTAVKAVPKGQSEGDLSAMLAALHVLPTLEKLLEKEPHGN